MRLATTVTGQVSEIEQITKMIKQGHYTSRVSIPKYPTLKEVSIAINALAETLEEQEDLRRRMTADIAHDLRTPLSIQQAVIEAIDDGIYPFDQSSLDALKTQNKYLIRLVEDLRTLALADANALNLKKGPLNLLELSKDVLEGYKSMMSKMNIRASVKSQATVLEVVADRDRVIQILHNLLDNALYYSPENTEICIDSVSNGNYTEIKISDQGPGIQVEPIDRVFDRYYSGKLDSNGFSAGSGLGLYISREIARAHDGYLLAENKADGGAIFRLGLPISDQQSSKDYMAKGDKNR